MWEWYPCTHIDLPRANHKASSRWLMTDNQSLGCPQSEKFTRKEATNKNERSAEKSL